MRSILKAYEDKTRKVWVADSFEGLPPPDVVKYPQDRGLNLYEVSYLSVSLEQVQNNFKKYEFLKGFFCDTLENAPINKLSLLRLDGDLYQSTMEALVNLYPKLSIGGYVIIDDFGAINACAQAVNDFRSSMNITDPITWVDYSGIYWKKTQ